MKSALISVLTCLLFLTALSNGASIPQPVSSPHSKAVNVQLANLRKQVNELKQFRSCFAQILPVTTVVDGSTIWLAQGDQTNSVFVPTMKETCVG